MFFTSLIYFVSVLTLCFFNQKEFMQDLSKLTMQEFIILVTMPIFVLFFANYLYYDLLKHYESSIVTSLVCCSPIFTLLISFLFLKEQVSKYGIAGILMVTGGVCLISMN
jgi:drug/metabolite transporter (DMT)-like permease